MKDHIAQSINSTSRKITIACKLVKHLRYRVNYEIKYVPDANALNV